MDDNETEDQGIEGGLGAVDEGADDEASLQPVTVESVKQGEMNPLELADMYRRSRIARSQAATDLKAQIERARNVILNQPTKQSKADWLLGIGSTLLAPGPVGRAGTLGESLGSLGKYVSDVTERERKAKALQAQQLANFDLTAARTEAATSREDERALASMMNKYLGQKAPKLSQNILEEQHYRSVINDPNASADEKTYARAYLANKVRPPASTIQKPDQQAHDYEVVSNPSQYKPSEVLAAQARIDKFTKQGNWAPPDVRKEALAKDKNAKNYLVEMKDQLTFTLPDIDSAISQIDEGSFLATGNLSNWLIGTPWIGQPATDLEKTLESVRARLGFEKLEKLKKMSPTASSGLGAVSNAEQKLLQSVRGSLARDQGAKNLRSNLVRIKKFYEDEVPSMLRAAGIENIDTALYAIENPEAPSGGPQGSGGPSGGAGGISRDAIQAELARRRKK